MKHVTIMVLGLPALVVSSTWSAACYDPCGYPGATGAMCGAPAATGGSSGSGSGCTSDHDCHAMATECQPYACHAGACQKGAPRSAQTPCGPSPTELHCDGMGSCVSCSDGLENGDEEGVDCGGFCVLACEGAACTKDDGCKSGRCAADVCLKPAASACKDDGECATSRCDMGSCATCSGAGDCKSQQCDAATGRCKAPPGAPCADDHDCANGTCDDKAKLCQGTYMTQGCAGPAGCTTGYCFSGICLYCDANSECLSNECLVMTGDSVGNCALPANAYCTPGAAPCASGFTCKGAPATCQ